jgi:hypothetical protein
MPDDTSRNRQRWHVVIVLVAGAFVIPCAVLALGTFVPSIPYLSTVGSAAMPLFAPQILVAALVGGALALAARRRAGAALAIVGLLAAAGAGLVVGRHARVGSSNGAHVNLLAALVPRGLGSAAPDATVTFTRVDGQDLSLDIYRPKGAPGRLAPILFYIHGGGWILGDRTMQAANLRWFAEHGYLAVSAEYVLANENAADMEYGERPGRMRPRMGRGQRVDLRRRPRTGFYVW